MLLEPAADAPVVEKETIELAFLIAIRHLPPRQRAVLILRDVLGWPAAETSWPGPTVRDDPLGAFVRIRDQVQADLDDPAKAWATFDGRFGRWTFAEAIDRAICLDLAVHGWDLARAAGQDGLSVWS
ncbi:sigma factor-like helix-turn-helix DNA-binding protein [Acrocarpospora sp. B8E8]|uniref:sigma factor-like helix-turn-helix DNA-binding protein n=1 Tax=Acrocarpospora sp. B8E8 TaxID=3153572 RepID=UPI00325E350E